MNLFFIMMAATGAGLLVLPVLAVLAVLKSARYPRLPIVKAGSSVFVCIFLALVLWRVLVMSESAAAKFSRLVSAQVPAGVAELEGTWNYTGRDPHYCFRFTCSNEAYEKLLSLRAFRDMSPTAPTEDTEATRSLLRSSTLASVPAKWRDELPDDAHWHEYSDGLMAHVVAYSPETSLCIYVVYELN